MRVGAQATGQGSTPSRADLGKLFFYNLLAIRKNVITPTC